MTIYPHIAVLAMFAAACTLSSDPASHTGDPSATDTQPSVLVESTDLPAGHDTCPAGGLHLQAGHDDGEPDGIASNGILEAAEIERSFDLCNGIPGEPGQDALPALVDSLAIAQGSPSCPAGGLRLRLGYDDGAGGGIAADGLLQEGEVRGVYDLCNQSPGAHGTDGALVAIDPVSPGPMCLRGGLIYRVGADDGTPGGIAADGILQPEEVDTATSVCSAANAAPTLFATEAIAPGDPRCVAGGLVLQIGLDDGKGGGMAADGVLQPSEVRSTSVLCDGLNQRYATDATLPDAPLTPGTSTLSVAGGPGAPAGSVVIEDTQVGEPQSAWIRIHATGLATPSLPPPPSVTPDLGDSPAFLADGDVIYVVNDILDVPEGAYFIAAFLSGAPLMKHQPGGVSTRATGVRIPAHATVTLQLDAHNPHLSWSIDRMLWVEGTLRIDAQGALETPTAEISAEQIRFGISSTTDFDTSGAIEDTGATLSLHVRGVYGKNAGAAQLLGNLTITQGPDAQPGHIGLQATPTLWLAGQIGLITGPSTSEGVASLPGSIDVRTDHGLYASGLHLTAQGATGLSGGQGGAISLEAAHLHLSGALLAQAGLPVGCANCVFAPGGQITLRATEGPLEVAADLDASAGFLTGDLSGARLGGQAPGGHIAILIEPHGRSLSRDATLTVGGNLHAYGLQADDASVASLEPYGGQILIQRTSTAPGDLSLYGYTEANLSGGAGAPGGRLQISRLQPPTATDWRFASLSLYRTGGLIVDTPFDLRGGPELFGDDGGLPGFVDVALQASDLVRSTVLWRGAVDLRADNAHLSHTVPGFHLHGTSDVQWLSDLTLTEASDGPESDAPAVVFDISGDFFLASHARLQALGAEAYAPGTPGGHAPNLLVFARTVQIDGTIATRGGASFDSAGGDGGDILLVSQTADPQLDPANLDVSGGDGTPAGASGTRIVNGVVVHP